jgi:hypothetical protein
VEARQGMTFHLVDSIDQVLGLALEDFPQSGKASPVLAELVGSSN